MMRFMICRQSSQYQYNLYQYPLMSWNLYKQHGQKVQKCLPLSGCAGTDVYDVAVETISPGQNDYVPLLREWTCAHQFGCGPPCKNSETWDSDRDGTTTEQFALEGLRTHAVLNWVLIYLIANLKVSQKSQKVSPCQWPSHQTKQLPVCRR